MRIIAVGTAPDTCSQELPVAPGRGEVVPFREVQVLSKGEGDFELSTMPYRSGCPGRARDIFDVMTEQATRRKGGVVPFTAAQVEIARDYRDLCERIEGSGIKCSSTFSDHIGGQGKVDFMDAYMRDTERLALFRAAIGEGLAMETKRRVAANVAGIKVGDIQLREIGRKMITSTVLVDMVCIAEKPLSGVLEAHGWRATGKNRMTLRAALCAALGRMQGV
ncbi:hypothetical protein [Halocynthiibacter sp.]|uniref:hypothetical protein n=1 Tax=Halocynthiibacter sp. TaxID=1979210 RepID=UPI003C572425